MQAALDHLHAEGYSVDIRLSVAHCMLSAAFLELSVVNFARGPNRPRQIIGVVTHGVSSFSCISAIRPDAQSYIKKEVVP